MEKPLTLSEKLYLLAIEPVKGGIMMSASSTIRYVMGGAILLELQKNGNIEIEGRKFRVKNQFPESAVHRLVLSKVHNPERWYRLSFFISRLSNSRKLTVEGIRKMLIDRGIIRLKERQFLYLFRWKVPELVKKNVVYNILAEIEVQTFNNPGDEETVNLLALIIPANLLRRIFPDKLKRNQAREILKPISKENLVAEAIERAIRAARAAVAASV